MTEKEREARRRASLRWYLANREKVKQYTRAKRERRRQLNREYSRRIRDRAIENLGGACVVCGETERVVLEIDHINNDGKHERGQLKFRRAATGNIDGLQILCSNCHARKTRTGSPRKPSHAPKRNQKK